MSKPGSAYEQIVGAVCAALEPSAEVLVNTRKVGPDGRRDMDVSVRGVRDDHPYFALIECKDWTRKVGVHVVDALHSKRSDLGANMSVIYSNSGFTRTAERKAQRVGITLCAALSAGDRRIRVAVERTFYARTRSVDKYSLAVLSGKRSCGLPKFVPADLHYNGLPVVNWLAQKSRDLLSAYPTEQFIQARYTFTRELEFGFKATNLGLVGFALNLRCSNGWVQQTVREDVSLGSFDFLRRTVLVPPQQYWSLGPFDNEAWKHCRPPPPETPLEPNSFRLDLVLLRPIAPLAGDASPALDDLIAEQVVSPAPPAA